MAINKQKKADLVVELNEMVKGAATMVFVSFKNLTVNKTIVMRKKLHTEGVGYRVTKKTLLKRACAEQQIAGDFPEALSELAVVYGTDQLSPAALVHEFTKEYKGKLEIIGGVFDGKFMNKAEMLEIATIPSREVLLSKIAFLLQSPMQRLAIAVNEVSKVK
jgi:large subunit ribosomal protein L10